jgi:pilus assembly protein CpaE
MSEKILVVDDDVESLKLIGLMLKRQGYEVVAANAGVPAIQKAMAEQPDLIILDVMMPDMDGYEVCRRLRTDTRTTSIPIIMFTAKTMVDDKVAGFEAGADDYLTKPTHPAELSSRIKAVLARRQQQRGTSSQAPAGAGGLSLGFVGVKGGVGTTTLAVNVASLLSKEAPTLLTDVRPGQGTLSLSLGFAKANGFANVMRRPPNEINARLVEENVVSHNSGLRLLLSSVNPQESQLNLTPEGLAELIKASAGLATYRLYDLGAGLNRLSVRAIRDLDHSILLVEPNRVTLGAGLALKRELESIGIAKTRYSIVIFNRTQSSLQIPWQEVEQLLEHEVAAIISPAPELAYQSAEASLPITLYQPSSIVAGQVAKLVEELVKR